MLAIARVGPSQRRNPGSAPTRWSGDQIIEASDGDHRAERPREPASKGLAEPEPDADAEHVDEAGRYHEPRGKVGGVGGARQLDAMGVAVADRKDITAKSQRPRG